MPPAQIAVGGIAVHDLGGTGATALYAHATGFHAHCWSPVAARLPGLHNIGYDARGHGDTPIGTDWPAPGALDWRVYGDDAALVARSLAGDGAVLGVGHSMGGAALLMAALAEPDAFCGLVLYEPIVIDADDVAALGASGGNDLAKGARRRRSTFASLADAIAAYQSKPPLNAFIPEAMEAYVRHGFAAGDDGQEHLKCTPEHEARSYEAAPQHETWRHLGEITIPVWLLCGRPEAGRPSERTASVAAEIPGARYIELDHLGHFGPMQGPDDVAALVGEAAMAFHDRQGDPFRP